MKSIRLKINPNFEIYALLWLSKQSEEELTYFLNKICKINISKIVKGMHLTLYYGRRPLSVHSKAFKTQFFNIKVNIDETRFMVFKPGGENPKKNIVPSESSVGIRLTKRNKAIKPILELRRQIYKYEQPSLGGQKRNKTSDWINAYGSRHFQPHIKLIKPNNNLDYDLSINGKLLRENLDYISFNKVEVISKSKKR
tara:strand:- start:47 stop:637 length:591 start_codon:yes stop_codon:yes gene_type:complete